MNTKLLLIVSAIGMALAGSVLTFLPHELLLYFGQPAIAPVVYLVQLAGGLYLAFAMQNWMAKGGIIGGIYSRPLAMANFLHFMMGAILFLKAVFSHPTEVGLWLACGIYCSFAVLFSLVLFRYPLKQEKPSSTKQI